MDVFRVGMIGCGTVGTGVLELLDRRRDDLRDLLGRSVEAVRVAVRDVERPRHRAWAFVDPDAFTDDVSLVTDDPEIDVVVEVAGGVDSPRDWIIRALERGKDVVTANKATLAAHGDEIFAAAKENGRSVFYEASVAAALPIIELIQNGLVANRVDRLSAILNGTCNYILTRMERDGMEYDRALSLAQELGFAEADPTLDVNGMDSAHKLTLLASLICRTRVPLDRVYTEGIERISRADMEFAKELGYRIKLLGIAKQTDDGAWDLRVHPTLVRLDSMLARVDNEYNACALRADAAGPMLVYGNGAGAFPTASSVVADIVRSAKGERSLVHSCSESVRYVPIDDLELRSYVRLTVRDVPGVLGRVTSHFGMKGISISSIRQPDSHEGHPVPIVLVTHAARDRVVTGALRALESASLLAGPPTRIRIEEYTG